MNYKKLLVLSMLGLTVFSSNYIAEASTPERNINLEIKTSPETEVTRILQDILVKKNSQNGFDKAFDFNSSFVNLKTKHSNSAYIQQMNNLMGKLPANVEVSNIKIKNYEFKNDSNVVVTARYFIKYNKKGTLLQKRKEETLYLKKINGDWKIVPFGISSVKSLSNFREKTNLLGDTEYDVKVAETINKDTVVIVELYSKSLELSNIGWNNNASITAKTNMGTFVSRNITDFNFRFNANMIMVAPKNIINRTVVLEIPFPQLKGTIQELTFSGWTYPNQQNGQNNSFTITNFPIETPTVEENG